MGLVQKLWEFASYLDVDIELSAKHRIEAVQEGDRSFMGWLLEEGFEGKIAKRLNRVRKYKSLIHVSDGARSNGHTLDPAILTDEPGEPSTVTFSLERPTKTDFQLWAECQKSITSHSLQLLAQLGPFICRGHRKWRWFQSQDKMELYFCYVSEFEDSYKVYMCPEGQRRTRHGQQYVW